MAETKYTGVCGGVATQETQKKECPGPGNGSPKKSTTGTVGRLRRCYVAVTGRKIPERACQERRGRNLHGQKGPQFEPRRQGGVARACAQRSRKGPVRGGGKEKRLAVRFFLGGGGSDVYDERGAPLKGGEASKNEEKKDGKSGQRPARRSRPLFGQEPSPREEDPGTPLAALKKEKGLAALTLSYGRQKGGDWRLSGKPRYGGEGRKTFTK